jgi:hypothetical protein
VQRKSIPDETRSEFERKCSGLRARLKQLEAIYEKKVDDLPGPFLSHVDLELYRDLLMLAREGLTIVKAYRAYFPALSLYEDGMFWFGLFQFINAAGGRFWDDGDQVKIPEDITRELALVLVEISWFSTATGGDIVQRNLEALGSTVLAFGDGKLEEQLRRKARAMRLKRVNQFMDQTLRVVAPHRKARGSR